MPVKPGSPRNFNSAKASHFIGSTATVPDYHKPGKPRPEQNPRLNYIAYGTINQVIYGFYSHSHVRQAKAGYIPISIIRILIANGTIVDNEIKPYKEWSV